MSSKTNAKRSCPHEAAPGTSKRARTGAKEQKQVTQEKKQVTPELQALRDLFTSNGRLSYQACDKIAAALLAPHPNDKLSAIEIVAKFQGLDDWKAVQASFYEKKLSPPVVVKLNGRSADPTYCDVYIGRAQTQGGWDFHKDSILGNPVRLKWKKPDGKTVTLAESLSLFKIHMKRQPRLLDMLHHLAGKKIGCWCVDHSNTQRGPANKCHGEVIVDLFCELFVPVAQA